MSVNTKILEIIVKRILNTKKLFFKYFLKASDKFTEIISNIKQNIYSS